MGYSVLFLKHITLLWQKPTPALVLAAQGESLLHPMGSPSSVPLQLSLRFGQLLVTKPIQCALYTLVTFSITFFQAPTKKQL